MKGRIPSVMPPSPPVVGPKSARTRLLGQPRERGKESFRRVGQETWWRLPVSANMLLDIHHAGRIEPRRWRRDDGVPGGWTRIEGEGGAVLDHRVVDVAPEPPKLI